MMTREEILEIDAYCQEHKVSYRQRLEELDIPFRNFYKAKKKYRLQDEAAADGNMPGGFVQPGAVGFLSEHVNAGAETADIAARTASAAASKLFAQQMTQMARMDAVRPQRCRRSDKD